MAARVYIGRFPHLSFPSRLLLFFIVFFFLYTLQNSPLHSKYKPQQHRRQHHIARRPRTLPPSPPNNPATNSQHVSRPTPITQHFTFVIDPVGLFTTSYPSLLPCCWWLDPSLTPHPSTWVPSASHLQPRSASPTAKPQEKNNNSREITPRHSKPAITWLQTHLTEGIADF